MSQLLFIIVMEALRRMISAFADHDFMTKFLVGDPNKGTHNVSRLLFVDDTLLFCKTDQNLIKALKVLLLCFELASSLKINFDKSELVPFGNVCNINQLSNFFGCKVFSFPMIDLDLPLGVTSRALAIWDTVIEKI